MPGHLHRLCLRRGARQEMLVLQLHPIRPRQHRRVQQPMSWLPSRPVREPGLRIVRIHTSRTITFRHCWCAIEYSAAAEHFSAAAEVVGSTPDVKSSLNSSTSNQHCEYYGHPNGRQRQTRAPQNCEECSDVLCYSCTTARFILQSA